jgi:hypothetical protein
MSYLTQGTVHVECKNQAEEVAVTISPSPDYCVRHKEMLYAVFVESSGVALIYDRAKIFRTTDAGIKAILIQAALNATKVEISVKGEGTDAIEAVKVPAMAMH